MAILNGDMLLTQIAGTVVPVPVGKNKLVLF